MRGGQKQIKKIMGGGHWINKILVAINHNKGGIMGVDQIILKMRCSRADYSYYYKFSLKWRENGSGNVDPPPPPLGFHHKFKSSKYI